LYDGEEGRGIFTKFQMIVVAFGREKKKVAKKKRDY